MEQLDLFDKNITVYGAPNCNQCIATTKYLASKGLQYDYKDVSNDTDLTAYLKAKGFSGLPVVETDGNMWSGFRPDILATIA